MAVRQVIVSDISGAEVPDGKTAQIMVSDHPLLSNKSVVLDASSDEAAKLETTAMELVTLTITEDGKAPRLVVMAAADFDAQFADVAATLGAARTAEQTSRLASKRFGEGRSSAPKAEKVDYTAKENYGVLHRGKVTDEEAALVRDNLEQANKNRKRHDQPAIDPKDEKEKKRYGFK